MPMKSSDLKYAHDDGHADVCYSLDGSKYMTCGTDGDVRIWSVDDSVDTIHCCVGEWACCVRQCKQDLLVATGNNDIQILSLPSGERNGVLDRFVAPINHIAVNEKTEHIALAGEDMEVKVYSGPERTKQVFAEAKGPCLSVALSSDGKYVAASSGDGFLRIWDLSSNKLAKDILTFPKVNSFKNAKSLCRIDFHPNGQYLAYPTNNTVVILNCSDWSRKITLECGDQVQDDYSIVQYSPCGDYLIATSITGDFSVFKISSESVIDSVKHVGSKAITGLMWNPLGNGEVIYIDCEGQLGNLENCIPLKTATEENEKESNQVDFSGYQFEDDEDDENTVSVEKLKKQVMGEPEPELNFDTEPSRSPTPRPRTPQTPLQEPFMPTSTPEHLNPRYLCWNDVGVMRAYNSTTDSYSDTIEIEFLDSNFHNNMMLPNYNEYTMGTVGKSAVVVANASQMNVIPLSSSTKEWNFKLEDGDQIRLVATSTTLVAMATERRRLRLFSVWGDCGAIFATPGPVVSMCAHERRLLVAYHAGAVRMGDQCLGVTLYTTEGYSVGAEYMGTVPLAPSSTLSWLGFGDLGTPAMMDSTGELSLWGGGGGVWMPFCDTTKHCTGAGDGFFVTSLFESCRVVVGIKCKGTIYPGFTPRPTVAEIPLQPPYGKIPTEQETLELELFTRSHLKNEDRQSFNKTALKAFAIACKNGAEERAFSLMEKSANVQLLNLAVKYAVKMNKKSLAEKLTDLNARIEQEDETNENVPPASCQEPVAEVVIKPKPISMRKLSTKLRKTPRSAESIIMEGLEFINNTTLSDSLDYDTSATNGAPTPPEPAVQEPPQAANPFLKSLKRPESKPSNPLSLTDREAGVEFEQPEIKRKKPDSEVERQPARDKQRKLDKFMFTKTNRE